MLFALMVSPAIKDRIFVYDDLLAYAFPFRVFYSYCLKHSQDFFWLPSVFNGYYVHGEGQIGMLHPLHLLLYRFLSVNIAFQIELVLPYLLIFFGMKLWLEKRLDETAALFGAFCFMTSSFCAFKMVHSNALQVVAHYPWLLITLDQILAENNVQNTIKGSLLWSLLLGSMILIGYPQYILISLFLQAIYLGTNHSMSRVLKSWNLFFFFGILGLGIGAAQLFPTIEYFNDSERVKLGIDFIGSGSLNPLEFFQLWGPYIYKGRSLFSEEFGSATHEYGLYEGFFAVFAIIWLIVERPQDKNKLIKLGVLFLFVGLILSIGKYNGVFYFYGLYKPFALFRYHSRNRVLISFGLAILSAVAFSELISVSVIKKGKKLYLAPSLISLIIACIALAIKHLRPDLWHQFFSNKVILIYPFIFLCVGLVFYLGWANKRWAILVLLLLTLLDRSIYQVSFAFHELPREIDWTSYGKLNQNRGLEQGNWSLIKGGRSISGYLGVAPKRLLNYTSRKAQQAAAIESPEKFPRFWVVTKTLFSKNPSEDIEQIDLSTTALVDDNLELVSAENGSVKELAESSGRFEFETATKTRQLLVISESFHRGWRATVDGVNTTVRRVNGDFIGVVLQPGVHVIELHFLPWSVLWGGGITGLSIIIVIFLFLFARKISTVCRQKQNR